LHFCQSYFLILTAFNAEAAPFNVILRYTNGKTAIGSIFAKQEGKKINFSF
jgi:hypothetical protein